MQRHEPEVDHVYLARTLLCTYLRFIHSMEPLNLKTSRYFPLLLFCGMHCLSTKVDSSEAENFGAQN